MDLMLVPDVTNNLTFEGSKLIVRLGRVETEELRKLATVLSIFVNTKLDVFTEGLVEFGEVVLVFSNLAYEVHGLFHKVLTDHLEDFVLLKRLTGDVKRKVFRVNDALNKVKIFRNKVLAIVHDEHTADVELDVVSLFLGLKQIERSTR